jgi:hypothetical protein
VPASQVNTSRGDVYAISAAVALMKRHADASQPCAARTGKSASLITIADHGEDVGHFSCRKPGPN